jgi:hypothetical protein
MQNQCMWCDKQQRSVNEATKERNRNRLLLFDEQKAGIGSRRLVVQSL